jgi:hypothetical protein
MGNSSALKRPQYAAETHLAAQDLLSEQRYRLQRLRRHNRYLHAWGVVCGLWVVPARDSAHPWAVQVCRGYAIGPYGDEIEVPVPAVVDVRDFLWRLPPNQAAVSRLAYVGLRYAEQERCPVPTTPPGCGCNEPIYKPSRLRDSFQVDILWALPDSAAGEFDLCEQGLALCPECPESPYLVLACLNLPASEGDPIASDKIDNWSCRRWL